MDPKDYENYNSMFTNTETLSNTQLLIERDKYAVVLQSIVEYYKFAFFIDDGNVPFPFRMACKALNLNWKLNENSLLEVE